VELARRMVGMSPSSGSTVSVTVSAVSRRLPVTRQRAGTIGPTSTVAVPAVAMAPAPVMPAVGLRQRAWL
jgi:hypothetical protein